MLESLIESRRTTVSSGVWEGSALSLLVHSALITAAVVLTLRSQLAPATYGNPLVPVELPPDRRPPPPPVPRLPLEGSFSFAARLAIPTGIPTVIPPPATAPFDATRFSGFGADSADVWNPLRASRPVASAASVYAADVVEERPERIGGPALRYPDLLRQAGIEGQVTVECVVDTTGHAEPGSLAVTASSNAMFDRPALEAVGASLFRPGRLDGRAVRVRVSLPVVFQILRPGAGRP